MAANMVRVSGSEAEASGLVNTLQGHVDDIRSLIQCGICIRPLYEPYTLACGHTFCYSCLSSWFSGGRSKRTCPDCRAPVITQPAPAYLVRAVVQMFTSRAELLDKGETTAEHSKYQQEEATRLETDKANTDPHRGGLFRGLFKPKGPSLKPVVDVDDGVTRCPCCSWELEDGEECHNCNWRYHPEDEVTEYSGDDDGSATPSYASGFESNEDEYEEDEFGDLDAEDVFSQFGPFSASHPYADPNIAVVSAISQAMNGLWHPGHSNHPSLPQTWRSRPHPHPQFYPNPRPHSHSNPHQGQVMHSEMTDYDDEDDEDEEDEYDDQDSFIDDEEVRPDGEDDAESDGVTVVGAAPIRNRDVPSWGPPRYSDVSYAPMTDDEEEGSGVDEEEDSFTETREPWEASSPSRMGAPSSSPTYHDTRSSPMVSEAETNDTADPEMAHAHRYYEQGFYPTDHDSEPSSDSSAPRPMRPARTTGVSAGNAITIDDSEDEQPVGPMRRATQRRRARATPY
ncbi:uncharacterized protein N7477_008518 [Penicillium maclennaniae]|uniref:uncharacterized protein n=1 Tax=Penicillium maclennaniae TaxID=1343394 RepID=UPI002540B953|nr:uncharacterized protein N7477_008518 [Penicillium maclennaniae]KAJ5666070.1 hypothetical protein N7477_008518 [Penicillium maclennaniae]